MEILGFILLAWVTVVGINLLRGVAFMIEQPRERLPPIRWRQTAKGVLLSGGLVSGYVLLMWRIAS